MKPFAAALGRVVLVDTGPLVAAIDAGDPHHPWAKRTLPQIRGRMFTCEAVASEAMHLLDNQPEAIDALQAFLERMEIVPVLRDELAEVFSVLRKFAPRMDLADGCLIALSARHRNAVILTTDTRDFATYRFPFASPQGIFAEG